VVFGNDYPPELFPRLFAEVSEVPSMDFCWILMDFWNIKYIINHPFRGDNMRQSFLNI